MKDDSACCRTNEKRHRRRAISVSSAKCRTSLRCIPGLRSTRLMANSLMRACTSEPTSPHVEPHSLLGSRYRSTSRPLGLPRRAIPGSCPESPFAGSPPSFLPARVPGTRRISWCPSPVPPYTSPSPFSKYYPHGCEDPSGALPRGARGGRGRFWIGPEARPPCVSLCI